MEEYDASLDKYLNEIVDDISKVVGEVYLITNNKNNKQYVGQTKSHRLNHKRYRPFGYIKRFGDHCSVARTTPSKNYYIINAIRKYGEESFTIQLIRRCSLDELDMYEKYYICQYNTLYPQGYNLTVGGKNTVFVPVRKVGAELEYNFTKQYRTFQKTETKAKISNAIKAFYEDDKNIDSLRTRAVKQHDENRKKIFAGCSIDASADLESYIRKSENRKTITFTVVIGQKRTNFHGKKEDYDSIKQRVYTFLRSLQQHDQIAGNP